MVLLHSHSDLTVWKPEPTVLPEKWVELANKLAAQGKGSLHRYVLNVRYDSQAVGDTLRCWGLPWPVVMAGYLWEYDKEQIRSSNLDDTDDILSLIDEANFYASNIEDDNLLVLLKPPYRDLGALLIAVAIYYHALKAHQELSNEHPLTSLMQPRIERIGETLLNISTILGMWHFKHQIEDLNEQLYDSQKFVEDAQELARIVAEDEAKLRNVCELFADFYLQTTRRTIHTFYSICNIRGMRRRYQDAHTTITSLKRQLTGFDLATFEILAPTIQECYAILGVLSQLGQIQDRVTDLIATPKLNGLSHLAFGLILKLPDTYENLLAADQQPPICQIQISTPIMHAVAWYGCLFPRCYQMYIRKTHQDEDIQLLPEELWNSAEGKIFSAIKQNLTSVQIQNSDAPLIVYDKNNRPIGLKKGATALDFAYELDNAIGEHAVDAIVNNRKTVLYQRLNAADIVEIRTSEEIQVRDYWAHFTTTAETQRKITETLNRRSSDRRDRGYSLLYQELARHHFFLSQEILHEELNLLVEQNNLGTPQAYLEQLDDQAEQRFTPKWAASEIMQQIMEHNTVHLTGRHHWIPAPDRQAIANKKLSHQHLCNFCQPTYPRDMKIMGRLHKHSGKLVVHRDSCPYLIDRTGHTASMLIPMIWELQPPAFQVAFFLLAQDRRGLILDIARQIRKYQCDLISIHAQGEIDQSNQATVRFTIETHNNKEVVDLWQRLRKIDQVLLVEIDLAETPIQVYDRLQKQYKQQVSTSDQAAAKSSWPEPAPAIPIQEQRSIILHNPFDISRPATATMFFGRTHETETMRRELCDSKNGKALILYGPLRSGKSSICRNFLDLYIQPPSWGVLFSLQNATGQTEETILQQLAGKISEEFSKQLWQPGPDWQDYHDTDPEIRFRHLLENCFSRAPDARLVLVLDEFGGVLESYQKDIPEYRFFTYWKELIAEFPQLSLVIVLPMSSHRLLTSKKFVNVFSFTQQLPISFLDNESAQQLLVDPLRDQAIEIHASTLTLALKLTGGNPYYMTLIGQQLIHYLNREIHQQEVTDADLRVIVDQLIEVGSSQNFDFLARELQNREEFLLLEKIVDLTEHTKQAKVQLRRIAEGLQLPLSSVRRHLDRLRIGLILDENGPQVNPYYSFKIDLVRSWLTRNRWLFANHL
ncbi:MAG TPA: ACT domain-containing protein [Ktedonobacteraceae bacterium]|nr:ACT domain-containing protein [Ktedonobacteraceae bacterium]